jgi:hypothetical protein
MITWSYNLLAISKWSIILLIVAAVILVVALVMKKLKS